MLEKIGANSQKRLQKPREDSATFLLWPSVVIVSLLLLPP